MGERPELVRSDRDVETAAERLLQRQRRDDRHEIGIAAALADAVERALDLAGAGQHRRQRVGNRLLGVVVGMNAEMRPRHLLGDGADDGIDLLGLAAAIGVA